MDKFFHARLQFAGWNILTTGNGRSTEWLEIGDPDTPPMSFEPGVRLVSIEPVYRVIPLEEEDE